jgi:hypothetical protein
MLPPSDTNWVVLIFVSSLIGGVVGGLSSLTGYSFRKNN